MKKLLILLCVLGGLYYCVGCKLVEVGSASINSNNSRIAAYEV